MDFNFKITIDVHHHGQAGGLTSPSSDTRLILAAIQGFRNHMNTVSAKLAASVAALIASDTQLQDAVEKVIADDIANRQNVKDAVTKALADQGVAEDAQADALATVDAALDAHTQAIRDLLAPPPAPEPLALTTTDLPVGTAGAEYSATLTASGGVSPYSFSSSPPSDNGATINSDGTVTGTLVDAVTSSFSVTVTDSATPPASASGAVSLSAI